MSAHGGHRPPLQWERGAAKRLTSLAGERDIDQPLMGVRYLPVTAREPDGGGCRCPVLKGFAAVSRGIDEPVLRGAATLELGPSFRQSPGGALRYRHSDIKGLTCGALHRPGHNDLPSVRLDRRKGINR